MSDTQSAQLAFLYGLQRDALARVGRVAPQTITNDETEVWSEHLRAGAPASPFDDSRYARLLSTRQWEVEDALEHLHRRVEVRPVLGTLPYRTLNAHSVAVPDRDASVIVFDEELYDFLLIVAWIVSHAMPEHEDPSSAAVPIEAVRECARSAEQPFAFYRHVMLGYLLRGRWGALDVPPLEGPRAVRAVYLWRIASVFIIAHEYAHLLPSGQQYQCRAEFPPGTPTAFAESWRAEHAADELATFASAVAHIRLAGTRDGFYLGPALYFFSHTLLLHGLHMLATGTEPKRVMHAAPVSSHPPPMNRLIYLTSRGSRGFGEEMKQYDVPIGAVMEVLKTLFYRLAPELHELHRSGERPHASWPLPTWMAEPNSP